MTIEAADPYTLLSAATLLVLLSVTLPKLGVRWPLWAWGLWRTASFIGLTLLVLRTLGSPLEPRFSTAHPGLQFWEQLVEASWWVAAARMVVGLARLFVVPEDHPRETRIVSDLLAGAMYVATFLAVVNFAFSVPIAGLLATSGVIAIVLGLALQSTLSDVFSGIAVGIERPYEPGDLLWVEGGIEGHVVEVNWRSTHIATGHNNVAVVPNSIIAKSRLINRSAPTPMRGDSISVSLDADTASDKCLATLTAAMRACRILRAEPAPSVACTGLVGDGVVYEISFSVDGSDWLRAARDELFRQVHRHLRHAGIALAVPNSAVPRALPVPTLGQLLEESDLFGLLDPEDRALLAKHFTVQWVKPSETLIREGEMPDALFIIASGTAEITRKVPQGPRVLYRMSPGESLGAVGLITGTPYTATATALTQIKAYRLAEADIAVALKATPKFAAALEALAERGQATLSRNAAVLDEAELEHPQIFLPNLRNFLRRLAS